MSVVRFSAADHSYTVDGERVPSITQMLQVAGWIDDRWYTEESSKRGTAVHKLTADFDLGALDVVSCVSPYRGYLLSHVAAMDVVMPEILAVEEFGVSPLGFGGRPDREVRAWDLLTVLEGKSGSPDKAYGVQTALQAILIAPKHRLPAEAIARLCLYWKADGKFRLEEHRSKADFAEAYRIIGAQCVGDKNDSERVGRGNARASKATQGKGR